MKAVEEAMANEIKHEQEVVTSSTSNEHDAIVAAVQVLEAALASPATNREDQWHERIEHDLAPVVATVQHHCQAAEAEGGLVKELEAMLGRPRSLAIVSREHEQLAAEAQAFFASLATASDVAAVRARAAALTADLRAHQAQETDLIYEAFFRDIGVGD
jgi:predicted transcriptional regulator